MPQSLLGTGLDLQHAGCKVASGCGLVVKLSAGLDTLVVRPSSPFPEVCPPGCGAQSTGKARKEKSATHHRGRDVQGAVAPGRAPAIASDAPTLDSLLLSSVLASSLTLSCQPASRGWRLLPPGQLGSNFEVRGLSGAVVARPVHFSAFIDMPWELVPTLPWRQPGCLAPHHLSSSVARQEDTSYSDSSTGPMAPWPPRLPQSPTSRLLVCVASRSSTALSSGGPPCHALPARARIARGAAA